MIFANESMSESTRRDHLVSALKEDLPALTVEVGLLYLEESPEDAWALGVVGQALFYMGRYDEAEAMYARALIGVEPHRRRRLLNQLGDLKAAQLDFAAALGSSVIRFAPLSSRSRSGGPPLIRALTIIPTRRVGGARKGSNFSR